MPIINLFLISPVGFLEAIILWEICFGKRKSSNCLYIKNSNKSGINASTHKTSAAIGEANQLTNTDATPQATVKGINPINA